MRHLQGKILLLFACNDHRNGLCTRRFDSAEIGRIRLEGPPATVRYLWIRPPIGGRMLVVGDARVAALSFCSWVGNWCWDGATVRPGDALAVLRELYRRSFEPVEAPADVMERWGELAGRDQPSWFPGPLEWIQ